MAHIHDKPVARCAEHAMQRNRQLDDAKIWPEVSAGLRENPDQFVAYFLRELWQVLLAQSFYVRGRTDSIEQALWRGCRRCLRRV